MSLRDNKNMDGRLRADVAERKDAFVLKNFFRRKRALHDFAEDAFLSFVRITRFHNASEDKCVRELIVDGKYTLSYNESVDWKKRFKERLIPIASAGGASRCSVLALIGRESEKPHSLLLMKRTMEVDSHRGQICFPGGYREEGDESLSYTALRETFEEIGVAKENVEVVGALQPVLTRGSVSILPFIGFIDFPIEFTLSRSEVERLFFLPLGELVKNPLRNIEVMTESGVKFKGPTLIWEGETVWGATARMLVELREHLVASQFSEDD